MLTVEEENELMTRVEGDAPMGQLIRRHWIPACLGEGPITDRSRDRLGASDLAVVEFRRVAVDMAKKFKAGAPAFGTRAANGAAYIPQADIRSFEAVLPAGTDRRDPVNAKGQRTYCRTAGGWKDQAANHGRDKRIVLGMTCLKQQICASVVRRTLQVRDVKLTPRAVVPRLIHTL